MQVVLPAIKYPNVNVKQMPSFFLVQFAEVVDKKVEDEARDRGSLSGRAEKLVRRKTKTLGAKKRYSKEQQQKVKEWKVRAEDAVSLHCCG